MGRERGPAGQEGEVGRPSRTPPPPPLNNCPPPPPPPAVGGGAKAHRNGAHCAEAMAPTPRCRNPHPPLDTITCGWYPMPGGTLPCLWVVPYAGRNPPHGGQKPPTPPPGMGGVAPLVSGSRPRRPCAAHYDPLMRRRRGRGPHKPPEWAAWPRWWSGSRPRRPCAARTSQGLGIVSYVNEE